MADVNPSVKKNQVLFLSMYYSRLLSISSSLSSFETSLGFSVYMKIKYVSIVTKIGAQVHSIKDIICRK